MSIFFSKAHPILQLAGKSGVELSILVQDPHEQQGILPTSVSLTDQQGQRILDRTDLQEILNREGDGRHGGSRGGSALL